MSQEHKRYRKPKNKPKPASNSKPKPHPISRIISNSHTNHANESRSSFLKNPKKKIRFLFLKLKGLGCKGGSLTASAPSIIRSASGWEDKNSVNRNQRRKKRLPNHRRNPGNVAVDVPDVCCTPPGIGITSDFPPRTRTIAPRTYHRKRSQVTRRHENGSDPRFSAILPSGIIASRTYNHHSAGEIIETMLLEQNLLSGRVFNGYDQYEDWRLNVDDMSYEELLDLGDKIGYVGRGLQEEQISRCLKKLKPFNHSSFEFFTKEWRCSICQEKCRDDEIGTLDCGHYHHVECIKQWLLQRNVCPVCKSAAML